MVVSARRMPHRNGVVNSLGSLLSIVFFGIDALNKDLFLGTLTPIFCHVKVTGFSIFLYPLEKSAELKLSISVNAEDDFSYILIFIAPRTFLNEKKKVETCL